MMAASPGLEEAAMIRGEPAYFSREHYEAHAGVAPPYLSELVVHCLELVALLAERRLPFRFKGGNSLLILLEDPQRFSIDVDIVTLEPRDSLTQVVSQVAEASTVFTGWESRAPKTKPWLPLTSFKIYFDSAYRPAEQSFVMLDAVHAPAPYPGVRKPVRCGTLYQTNIEVELPHPSGLIGDKLLAIGPRTLGIPFGKGKEAQRLKHVFDVATLCRCGYDRSVVRRAADGCQRQEEQIQGRTHAWAAISEDTRDFCESALAQPTMPDPSTIDEGDLCLAEIVRGFAQFREHLFRLEYTWELFQEDCRQVVALLEELDREPPPGE